MVPTEQDQVEKGIDRLLESLKDKDNIEKFLTLFLTQTQELEENAIALAGKKDVYTVQGEWLDWIGSVLGVTRELRDDDDYRAAILLEIGINTADGTPDNIISLINTYTGSTDTHLIEYYPAGMYIVNTGNINQDKSLYKLLQNIKPAGIFAEIIWNEDGDRFQGSWINSDGVEERTEHALFDWIEVSEFAVVSGGVEQELELSTGDVLEVVTSLGPNSGEEGFLSQVIMEETV